VSFIGDSKIHNRLIYNQD